MQSNTFKEFQNIITDLTLYLKHQYYTGMETFSSIEAKEMANTIDMMIENLSENNESLPQALITLEEVRQDLGDCARCQLSESRKNIVFGKGNPQAPLVFVGEAPGREEDLAGEPFVGEAGQLLTRIIHAINLRREDVYITNVVKCRPPNNRDPEMEEIQTCFPFLQKQLQAIRPRIICALGKCAAQSLLETTETISSVRGKIYEWHSMRVVPTFHPASLLRNPQWKREVWQDVQLIQKLIEESH